MARWSGLRASLLGAVCLRMGSFSSPGADQVIEDSVVPYRAPAECADLSVPGQRYAWEDFRREDTARS